MRSADDDPHKSWQYAKSSKLIQKIKMQNWPPKKHTPHRVIFRNLVHFFFVYIIKNIYLIIYSLKTIFIYFI